MADVRLTNVRKAFGDVPVLDGVDLYVADGEFVVFVGPSGCGKSTLLRIVAGLEDVTGGEVEIGGKPVNGLAPAKRGVAMVFQSYALYPHMTVHGNMAFGLKLAGATKTEIDGAVRAAAKNLHIEHLLERRPKALSGGQRQRVAIGRAIVREPQVFLFDEPLSNLDAGLRVSMRYEFARLREELGTTMIYVTHDQVEAMTLADRIVVLSAGRIEQIGTPMELYQRPANTFVAGFIGSPKMNLMAGEVESSGAGRVAVRIGPGLAVETAIDPAQAPSGAKVTLGIRPEHFEDATNANPLGIKVRFVEALGGTTLAYGALEGAEHEITVQSPGHKTIAAGDTLRVGVAPEACHVFDEEGRRLRI